MPDLTRKTIRKKETIHLNGVTLSDAEKLIDKLMKKCGPDAEIFFDSVYYDQLETVDEQFYRIKHEERTEEKQRQHDLAEAERLQKKWLNK